MWELFGPIPRAEQELFNIRELLHAADLRRHLTAYEVRRTTSANHYFIFIYPHRVAFSPSQMRKIEDSGSCIFNSEKAKCAAEAKEYDIWQCIARPLRAWYDVSSRKGSKLWR